MLHALCGSKSAGRVLLFLFVNQKCYGVQLHRLFNAPLTPIQKALARLENGGILTSGYEGKTRLYTFNPTYPLLDELQQLLQKVYTLLPPQEKKRYSFVPGEKEATLQEYRRAYGENQECLAAFWKQLSGVKTLNFHAKTRSLEETGRRGKGRGEVVVVKEQENVLIFQEKGSWRGENGQQTDFTNVFRWTIDKGAGMIGLEHLRFGMNHPVFLFHLIPTGKNQLASLDSHLCGGDTYLGKALFDTQGIQLNWRIIGPKKNEEIDYYYAPY